MKNWMLVLWPSFLVGGVGEVIFFTVFDPKETWVVDPRVFLSKSRNTPFAGWRMQGGAVATLVAGKVVWEA